MRDVRWILCGLALALAACGGPFDRGDELRDSDGDGYFGATDCDDHDPSAWQDLAVYRDADGDGVGVGELTMLCAGATPPAGWAFAAGDCDDARPGAYRTVSAHLDRDGDGIGSELVAVCAGDTLPAGYAEQTGDCDDDDAMRWRTVGRFADADLDGIGAGPNVTVCYGGAIPAGWSERTGDCDPGDPTRHQELGYLYSDGDGDGWLAAGPGTVCSGAELPPGYTMDTPAAVDCDDAAASRYVSLDGYHDSDGDGVGAGRATTFCTGGALPEGYVARGDDCAPDDPQRRQTVAYASVDADRDGVRANASGSLCTGGALPDGYFAQAVSAPDCDDTDASVHTPRNGYADPDLDGVSSGAVVTLCTGAALPEGWIAAPGNDCAPDDPTAWQVLSFSYVDADGDGWFVSGAGSLCTGATLPPERSTSVGKGLDCDDSKADAFATVYAYADADRDAVGAGAAQRFCNRGETPDGYSLAGTDCAPGDGARWRSVSYLGVDSDGDGYTVKQAGAVCLGDGPLPDPYRTALAGNDCNDADATLWRYVVLYPDLDDDGIGTTPRLGAICVGADLPEHTSIFGFDPDDADPTRRDGATAEGDVLAL